MKKKYGIFSAVTGILILGFTAVITMASADQTVFLQKCTKCHSARIPDNYTKKEWQYNVERMAQRAGLTQQEIKSIIDLNTKK